MGALDGIRVLAVENFIAGPYASMWLADRGAEVIKVERPDGGDSARGVPPFRDAPDGTRRSLSFIRSNRNKRSVALDLKSDEGRAVFMRLVEQSDVVIDNLRPDAMRRLGLHYDVLRECNPGIIYTTITGFGHDDVLPGPFRDRPAFDVIGQAMAGLMMRPQRDDPAPAYLGFPLTDIYASTLAVLGTMEALLERATTGVGQRVDVSLYDASVVMNELSVAVHGATDRVPSPGLHALTAPFGAYEAQDGYLAIAVLGERIWHRFCTAIGRTDLLEDERLQDGVRRYEHSELVEQVIGDWLSTRTRQDAVDELLAAGVPAAPVQDVDELSDCPQLAARNMLLQVRDDAWGDVRVVGNPVKMSGTPESNGGKIPALGLDTAAVLEELAGVSGDEYERLRRRGVVASNPPVGGDDAD